MILIWILAVIVAAALGDLVGNLIRRNLAKKNAANAEERAAQMLAEAKQKQQELLQEAKNSKQEMLIEAKEQALKLGEDARRDQERRANELQETQRRLEKRETMFDQKLIELEEKKTTLETRTKEIEHAKAEIQVLVQAQADKLQQVAGLSKADAEARLLKQIEEESSEALMSRLHKMDQIAEEEIDAKSRKILSLAIARFASSQVVETTTTSVDLPTDDMKGRIIGKEGRNIKAIELQTGTEIIVDDTPNAVTISGFSPIRRQVAKRALEALIKDGRIQPARIEECVAEAKLELANDIRKAGEEALYTLGIPVSSIDPKLISILGRLKYRTSYGQNVLQHSIEVATLAAMMAEELGADVFVCKKGGLFHDIGKAVDHDMQGAHPEIGYNIMKKFGFPEELCYQSIAHHEDKPRTVEGTIVKAADAISGARPGARKQSLEQFIQRMEELEKTAASFEGVEKAYAIQAGREVRVFVQPQRLDDAAAYRMARDIAKKIETDLRYPGEIRVTVIRETRSVEYAR
jgi:ribonuclease Y